jgi:hypothetical protein
MYTRYFTSIHNVEARMLIGTHTGLCVMMGGLRLSMEQFAGLRPGDKRTPKEAVYVVSTGQVTR